MSNKPQLSPHAKQERNLRILALRRQCWTWDKISRDVDLSGNQCRVIYENEMKKATLPLVDDLRKMELDKLESLEEVCFKVLLDNHYKISASGKLVYHGNAPIEDPAPVLDAVRTLKLLMDRKAKLLGLDAPQKIEATVTENTEMDRRLQEWMNEDKARRANQAQTQENSAAAVSERFTRSEA